MHSGAVKRRQQMPSGWTPRATLSSENSKHIDEEEEKRREEKKEERGNIKHIAPTIPQGVHCAPGARTHTHTQRMK